MCGIAGFIDANTTGDPQRQLLEKMLQAIAHRGPDARNLYLHGPLALGHNRLKIIDLSDEANQPFRYDDVVLIYNGEVYNYVELRDELAKLGYVFRTSSDTEVICAAYKHWGEACVKYFVGMWAFALWDETNGKLFCSRDRFGIKPFYYISYGESFWFASEYKSLKHTPHFNGQLNTEQINRGLQMGWCGFANETFYCDIRQLEPAHNIVWHKGRISLTRYWQIDVNAPAPALSFEEKKEKFFSLFKNSVALHARSDVTNGTCLSGGLDSSSISCVYSMLMPQAPIHAFTVYYEGKGAVDERPFAEEVAKKYRNIIPHYYSPTVADVAESFHRMAHHADVPVFGSSFISQYFLMRLAKQNGVTVVIDGQGSDEYLCGYLHSFYRIAGDMMRRGKIWRALKILHALAEREQFSAVKRFDFLWKSAVCAFADEEKITNLEYSRLQPYMADGKHIMPLQLRHSHPDKLHALLLVLLFETTLPTLLHFEDRNSMAFSLESRVPFLDHRLVEFAFTLPREDKVSDKAETKYILREALKNVLPHAIYARKDKKGFVTPGEVRWLNGPLQHLLEIDFKKFEWMKTERLRLLIENYRRGDTANATMVWRIAATHYWLKHFA
ncbi:MAG: asparagine synthase (glutamine-hydrolyzing) [Chitinophagales bacterium]|nr:asparagine synthase (glutamine-hydrolyzing) [Chitinophagales bacterium]MDW8419505.1 asparagine synthase (glutamine-hydrolyzing) [Chitinophagales bacterium]